MLFTQTGLYVFQGVKLLSYLYQETLNNCSSEHYPVLLSLLKTSCEPYTRQEPCIVTVIWQNDGMDFLEHPNFPSYCNCIILVILCDSILILLKNSHSRISFLKRLSNVFCFRFIHDWVYSGVFRDVYGEFMIQVNEDYLGFRGKLSLKYYLLELYPMFCPGTQGNTNKAPSAHFSPTQQLFL